MDDSPQPWEPKPEVIRALYQRATLLEQRWPSASVSETPGRMVEAVLRCSRNLFESSRFTALDAQDQGRLLRLLNHLWARNARRDVARNRTRRKAAFTDSIPTLCSGFERVHDGLIFRETLKHLLRRGCREEVAYSYLFACQGQDCEEICENLQLFLGRKFLPCTIRQWKRRLFPALSAHLRKSPGLFSTEVR